MLRTRIHCTEISDIRKGTLRLTHTYTHIYKVLWFLGKSEGLAGVYVQFFAKPAGLEQIRLTPRAVDISSSA